MRKIGLLRNTIQEYAWGSTTAIPELLGKPVPAIRPQAELWMGAHPKAPSQVLCDGVWRSLLEVIYNQPEEVLGREIAARFSNKLPFLFKVLAAAKPLSIQAHPNEEQARRGFVRENELGIPLDDPQRSYRDGNHKPEIICALTPFWALNGFRRIEEMLALFDKIQTPSLAEPLDLLRSSPNRVGLRTFFRTLVAMNRRQQEQIVKETVAVVERQASLNPVWMWMTTLHYQYPGDIGVLSPILLNLVRLAPGQALFLSAGRLHAYLEGVGIELMANSDNVLRGGLTLKHMDVDELLAILKFTDGEVTILEPDKLFTGEAVYSTEAAEFVLSVVRVDKGDPFVSTCERSVEIILCLEGEAAITDLSDGTTTLVSGGTSIIVPAAVRQYRINGNATIYKAAVPVDKRQ